MKSISVSTRKSGLAAITGGTIIVALGLLATVNAHAVGPAWFGTAAVAIGLFVAGLSGLMSVSRGSVGPGTRRALIIATLAFVLFDMSHVFAIFEADIAIALFSAFMVVGATALVVAGVGLIRADVGRGWRRSAPLLCGVWPLATIPAGAATGDVPHFLAVALWGACWIALGASLLTAGSATATTPRSVAAAVTP